MTKFLLVGKTGCAHLFKTKFYQTQPYKLSLTSLNLKHTLMSDLQILLIILGAFIIAGVVVYNWLQERKLRNQVTNEFIVPQKDVLAEDFYIDTDAFVEKELAEVPHEFKRPIFEQPTKPTPQADENTTASDVTFSDNSFSDSKFSSSTFPKSDAENTMLHSANIEAADDSEDRLTSLPSKSTNNHTQNSLSTAFKDIAHTDNALVETEFTKNTTIQNDIENALPQLPNSVHAHIDLTAILYANKQISHQALCDLAASIDDIRLPVMIYGLDSADKWHLVLSKHVTPYALAATEFASEISFKQAACSLQLADRGGPIAKNLLNKFQFAVENMGLELNAHVEWQGSGDVLQRAVELDKFCIEVDQLINVHVAQDETPIHGTKFRGLAEVNGMSLNDDGKFHYYANTDANNLSQLRLPLFCVIEANNQAFTAENLRSSVLKAVTFQLEIPKVPNCELAFNQMISVAQKLSSSLNARLVDDNQKPLGDLQIEKIRQQLKIIHATMVARGVMPGSPASMRLFN